MTNPRHARETENGRYYVIPGIEKPLPSVTNAISVGLSKYALPIWYANSATEAAWDALPLMLSSILVDDCGIKVRDWVDSDAPRPCGRCRPCLDRHVKEAAERARDSASFLGSRVHDLADAHVLGKTLPEQEGDDEAGLYVAQHLKFLKDFDIDLERDVVASEATVFDDHVGYAGTGDLWLRLPFAGFLWEPQPDGTQKLRVVPAETREERGVFLIDLKTSRKRASTQSFPDNVMQLAALRKARRMVLPGDEIVDNVPVKGAATLQLRAKTYRLIPLPSGSREFRLFEHVLGLASWLHNEWPGDYGYRPITPKGRAVPKRGAKKEDS